MKTIQCVIVFFFLLSISTAYAQIAVDNQGRAIFGKVKTVTNGIAFVDESNTTTPTPFLMTRKPNHNIVFSRSTGFKTFISRLGEVAIGKSWLASSFSPLTNIPLQIEAYDPGYAGIQVSIASSNYYGVGVAVKDMGNSSVPFAAYRNNSLVFSVKADGEVWSAVNRHTSDLSLKQNIKPITNPLEKVLQLRGVTFDMNFPTLTKEEAKINPEEAFKYAQQITPSLTREVFNQIQTEKSRQQMGVIAQEVEKVIPEVVRTREDGLKAVAYSELVGLFIEAFKEQQTIIDDLKLEVASLKGNQLRSSGVTGIANDLIASCSLAQNTPNPFTEQT